MSPLLEEAAAVGAQALLGEARNLGREGLGLLARAARGDDSIRQAPRERLAARTGRPVSTMSSARDAPTTAGAERCRRR